MVNRKCYNVFWFNISWNYIKICNVLKFLLQFHYILNSHFLSFHCYNFPLYIFLSHIVVYQSSKSRLSSITGEPNSIIHNLFSLRQGFIPFHFSRIQAPPDHKRLHSPTTFAVRGNKKRLACARGWSVGARLIYLRSRRRSSADTKQV